MDEYQSLSHTKWDCKYHVIVIPKYRRRALYGQLRRHLEEVFRKLAEQKESRIEAPPQPRATLRTVLPRRRSRLWSFAPVTASANCSTRSMKP